MYLDRTSRSALPLIGTSYYRLFELWLWMEQFKFTPRLEVQQECQGSDLELEDAAVALEFIVLLSPSDHQLRWHPRTSPSKFRVASAHRIDHP